MNELTTNGNVLNDLRKIIEAGRKQAYAAAGQIAVATYWNIGRRIVEEEQHGQEPNMAQILSLILPDSSQWSSVRDLAGVA